MTDPKKQPGISIGQIYLESASFRHREDHLTLPHTTPPNVGPLNLQLETGFSPDGQRALLRASVSTSQSKDALYSFDLTMVALLAVEERAANMPLERYVSVGATALLYPFIREAVANLTTRGRFGPIWIAPFNVQQAWAEADGSAGEVHEKGTAAKPKPKRAKKSIKRPE